MEENITKVRVYGMAGVGKTMLGKKIAGKAMKVKLFDKVVMVL